MNEETRARYYREWEKYKDKWTECMDTDALPIHEQVLHETFFGSEEIDRTLMLAVYDELILLQNRLNQCEEAYMKLATAHRLAVVNTNEQMKIDYEAKTLADDERADLMHALNSEMKRTKVWRNAALKLGWIGNTGYEE